MESDFTFPSMAGQSRIVGAQDTARGYTYFQDSPLIATTERVYAEHVGVLAEADNPPMPLPQESHAIHPLDVSDLPPLVERVEAVIHPASREVEGKQREGKGEAEGKERKDRVEREGKGEGERKVNMEKVAGLLERSNAGKIVEFFDKRSDAETSQIIEGISEALLAKIVGSFRSSGQLVPFALRLSESARKRLGTKLTARELRAIDEAMTSRAGHVANSATEQRVATRLRSLCLNGILSAAEASRRGLSFQAGVDAGLNEKVYVNCVFEEGGIEFAVHKNDADSICIVGTEGSVDGPVAEYLQRDEVQERIQGDVKAAILQDSLSPGEAPWVQIEVEKEVLREFLPDLLSPGLHQVGVFVVDLGSGFTPQESEIGMHPITLMKGIPPSQIRTLLISERYRPMIKQQGLELLTEVIYVRGAVLPTSCVYLQRSPFGTKYAPLVLQVDRPEFERPLLALFQAKAGSGKQFLLIHATRLF